MAEDIGKLFHDYIPPDQPEEHQVNTD
jgi:hypothetical protein